MEIVIIVLLLVLNGVFAMYEIALVSSSRARLKNEAARGSRKAETTLRLLDEPEKILSTIQIGITLIGIVSGAFGVWRWLTTSNRSSRKSLSWPPMRRTWP